MKRKRGHGSMAARFFYPLLPLLSHYAAKDGVVRQRGAYRNPVAVLVAPPRKNAKRAAIKPPASDTPPPPPG